METSNDMFLYTASESLFMISMAMCFFFCFQTYAVEPHSLKAKKGGVISVEFREVMSHVADRVLASTPFSDRLLPFLSPFLHRLEGITGKGGHMATSVPSSLNRSQEFPSNMNTDYTQINQNEDESRNSLYFDEEYERSESRKFEISSNFSTMTPIIEEDSQISDTMSNFSSNSRNFQMPEKDFAQHISKLKDMQMQNGKGESMLNVSINETNLI